MPFARVDDGVDGADDDGDDDAGDDGAGAPGARGRERLRTRVRVYDARDGVERAGPLRALLLETPRDARRHWRVRCGRAPVLLEPARHRDALARVAARGDPWALGGSPDEGAR